MIRQLWSNQLSRLFAGYFFDAIAANILGPLLALSMVGRGIDPATIGAVVAVLPLAYIAALVATPRLVRRWGTRQVFLSALVGGGLATLGFVISTNTVLWALLAVAAGLGGGVRYILAESMVSALAPSDGRGRAMAMFQTIVGAALFAASGLLMLTGAATQLPFLLAVVALVGALLILRTLPMEETTDDEQRTTSKSMHNRPPSAVRRPSSFPLPRLHLITQVGPLVLIAAFLSGLFEAGTGTAMPLYGASAGLSATFAAALVTIIGLGSFVQYPFGLLADRFPLRRVILATALITVFGALLLPLAHAVPMLLWGLSFVWGSLGGGLYTLATIKLGGSFRGPQLVAASSVAQFAYTAGSFVGPAVGGFAIELSPEFGLAATFAGIGIIGLLGMIVLTRREQPAPELPARQRIQVANYASGVRS